MIMIVGSNHDDILYFDSIMTGKRTEKVFGTFEVTFGSIFNQEVMLVDGVYTNYLSAALITSLIQTYYTILVFAVGKCTAWSGDWKIGDITISKLTFTGDVDQMEDTDARFGQIPGLPSSYPCQKDILAYLSSAFENHTYAKAYEATYVSTNVNFGSAEQLKEIRHGDALYGFRERVVLDSTLGGIAVACKLTNIPFIGAKVVGRVLDKPYTVEEYAEALGHYAELGKAVVTTIGDIGRNDIQGVIE